MATSTKKEAGPDSADLKIDHVSRQEAEDRGRAARHAVPRSTHGDWKPDPHRPSPVDIMIEQAATREPSLIPIRHAQMLVSPFTFYRGAAAIMAADLATTPVS